MGDRTSRAKVCVALIGVGATWDLHYRDAIQRLSSKLSVKVICDSVQMRAATIADEFEADPVSCPWQLTQRKDLHAWLILDPGWFDIYPAELAVRHRRPALFANTFALPIPNLRQVLESAHDRGELLMPEFPQRFTPSTTRLRELMATRLGKVLHVDISIPLPDPRLRSAADWLRANQEEAIGMIDWSSYLIGDAASLVTREQTTTGTRLELSYPSRVSRPDVRATILFEPTSFAQTRRVQCERGVATLTGPTQITWQSEHERGEDVLSDERSPYEIILDQFCRRALGGLVPVPTAHSAYQAIMTLEQCLNALEGVG